MTRTYIKWTNHEIARLKLDFGRLSHAELLVAFAPHPIQSIYTTAYANGARRQSRWDTICALYKPVTAYSWSVA